MKITKRVTSLLALLAVVFTSYASIIPASAAGSIDQPLRNTITIGGEVQDPNYDPFEDPYFRDLKQLSIEDARKVDTLGWFDTFEGVIREGGKFKPNSTFTRKQFKRMIRNLFDIKITIAEPDKACTAKWVSKQMKTIYKKIGIPFDASKYRKDSKKLTRIELVRELYKLFDEFDWAIEFCIFMPDASATAKAETAAKVSRFKAK